MYNHQQHLHFVGIGGVGMAGIAEVLLSLSYSISGSDLKSSALTERLSGMGATINYGHRAENLPANTFVVVVSSAVGPDNVEVLEANRRGIPVIPRAEMLAELMRMTYGVAVAGSHGKTSTTSMVAKLLYDIGLDPTVIVGGRLLSQDSGAKVGRGQYLVTESDESDGSFCLLRPAIAVVTNIDREHLSHYGSFGALEDAFHKFMSAVPFYGLVIACADDPVVAKLAATLKRRVFRYGFTTDAQLSARDLEFDGPVSRFTLMLEGREVGRAMLPVPGAHMVSNALAAVSVALELGAYVEEIIESLSTFPGVARRSEVLGTSAGVLFIDDYAHHPTEILSTLSAVKRSWLPKMASDHGDGEGRLIAVFQPHRYSRVRDLFAEFLTCFAEADEVLVTDVYSAGEQPDPAISGLTLAGSLQHPNATYVGDVSELALALAGRVQPGDVVIGMGAGSISAAMRQVAREFREETREVDHRTAQ